MQVRPLLSLVDGPHHPCRCYARSVMRHARACRLAAQAFSCPDCKLLSIMHPQRHRVAAIKTETTPIFFFFTVFNRGIHWKKFRPPHFCLVMRLLLCCFEFCVGAFTTSLLLQVPCVVLLLLLSLGNTPLLLPHAYRSSFLSRRVIACIACPQAVCLNCGIRGGCWMLSASAMLCCVPTVLVQL